MGIAEMGELFLLFMGLCLLAGFGLQIALIFD
jgi:hypothetical protein